MGLGRCSAIMSGLAWWAALVLLMDRYLSGGVVGYQNYTVGEDQGWTLPSSNVVDYRKWTSGKNFSLGDFLLFSYPQEDHNVVVTYNETVFKTCDFLDGNDGDYEVWGEAGKSTYSAIPLVRTGMNYFFCGAEGGAHCKGGMKFAINVTEGEGLPASLMVPPAAPADEEGGGDSGGDSGGGGGGSGGNGGDGGGSNGGDGGGSSYDSPSAVAPLPTPIYGLVIALVAIAAPFIVS
eukprot:c21213_g1_i1 orf=266-970(-)